MHVPTWSTDCHAPPPPPRVAGEVAAGVVVKCLNGRPRTKEGGAAVCLALVEAEQPGPVQEEVQKGLTNKQPKIVAGCLALLRRALQ